MIYIGLILLVLVVAICGGISAFSIKNTIIDMESLIDAQYVANKKVFELMWDKIVNSAEITEHQADKIKNVFVDLISGQENNLDNLIVSIKKTNPNLSSSIAADLQRVIAMAKKNCMNNQFAITERINEYNTYIQKHTLVNKFLNKQVIEMQY